jgi:hypothetical protein
MKDESRASSPASATTTTTAAKTKPNRPGRQRQDRCEWPSHGHCGSRLSLPPRDEPESTASGRGRACVWCNGTSFEDKGSSEKCSGCGARRTGSEERCSSLEAQWTWLYWGGRSQEQLCSVCPYTSGRRAIA